MLNSLLALLNSREHMRNQMVSNKPVSIQLSQDRSIGGSVVSSDRTVSARNFRVNIDLFGSRKTSSDQIQVCTSVSDSAIDSKTNIYIVISRILR